MTLDTRILIEDPIDPEEVFNFCRGLLTLKRTVEEISLRPEMTFTHDSEYVWDSEGQTYAKDPNSLGKWSYSNDPGQGLCAWLIVYYDKSGPQISSEAYAECDEDCNLPENKYYDEDSDLCDKTHNYRRPRWVTVSFDTSYGYSGPNNEGCGDLHAELVAKLGQFLDYKGVNWIWENEFTGEFHRGYDRLTDLGRGGSDANSWFRTTVLPTILANVTSTKKLEK